MNDFIEIPLKGHTAIIDASDAHVLKENWYAIVRKSGYVHVLNSKQSLARRIMQAPKGMVVDHINRDTLDNRRSNLRLCTVAENSRNRKGYGKFPHKGLALTESGRWVAQIIVNRKYYRLGTYDSMEKAALMYDVAAKAYHGAFARINFPNACTSG